MPKKANQRNSEQELSDHSTLDDEDMEDDEDMADDEDIKDDASDANSYDSNFSEESFDPLDLSFDPPDRETKRKHRPSSSLNRGHL